MTRWESCQQISSIEIIQQNFISCQLNWCKDVKWRIEDEATREQLTVLKWESCGFTCCCNLRYIRSLFEQNSNLINYSNPIAIHNKWTSCFLPFYILPLGINLTGVYSLRCVWVIELAHTQILWLGPLTKNRWMQNVEWQNMAVS